MKIGVIVFSIASLISGATRKRKFWFFVFTVGAVGRPVIRRGGV
jgi:hypothetical protein